MSRPPFEPSEKALVRPEVWARELAEWHLNECHCTGHVDYDPPIRFPRVKHTHTHMMRHPEEWLISLAPAECGATEGVMSRQPQIVSCPKCRKILAKRAKMGAACGF